MKNNIENKGLDSITLQNRYIDFLIKNNIFNDGGKDEFGNKLYKDLRDIGENIEKEFFWTYKDLIDEYIIQDDNFGLTDEFMELNKKEIVNYICKTKFYIDYYLDSTTGKLQDMRQWVSDSAYDEYLDLYWN